MIEFFRSLKTSKDSNTNPDAMSRRRLLKLVGVGLVAGALKESMPRLGALDLSGLHEGAPNRERIKRYASSIMKLPPGGCDDLAESTDPLDIQKKESDACRRNFRGTDERSIYELALLESLLGDDQRFPVTNDSIKAHLERGDNLTTTNRARQEFLPSAGIPAVSAGDLLLLLQVLGSRHAREKALEFLYVIQQKGALKAYGIEPLAGEKVVWAGEKKIEPWNLAWAETMKPLAEIMLVGAPEIWFDGLTSEEQKARIEHIISKGISNPGAIAMLEHTETKDMTYVGDVPFITQINSAPDYYPTAEHDMRRVASYLQNNWGLPYEETFEQDGKIHQAYQYTPGSLRGKKNSSGGAVFGQFMPINLLLFTEKYERTRQKLKEKKINIPPLLPGSPWGMSLLKYLYLNGEWKGVHGKAPFRHKKLETTKGGYMVGNEIRIKKALGSWNPNREQIQTVFGGAIDYYRTFEAGKSK